MSKSRIVVWVLAFAFASCSISKEIREDRKTIDGTWKLENVSYQGSDGSFKSKLFGDSEAVCFEGSTWFFRNNNSTGNYTIPSGSLCVGGGRDIRWSIIKNEAGQKQLQFKFIDENKNDIYGGTGYRLNIESLDSTQMTLESEVSVDGNPISVVYELNRISQ